MLILTKLFDAFLKKKGMIVYNDNPHFVLYAWIAIYERTEKQVSYFHLLSLFYLKVGIVVQWTLIHNTVTDQVTLNVFVQHVRDENTETFLFLSSYSSKKKKKNIHIYFIY